MNPVTLSALEIVRPGDARYDEVRPGLEPRPSTSGPPLSPCRATPTEVVAAVLYAKREGPARRRPGHRPQRVDPLGDLERHAPDQDAARCAAWRRRRPSASPASRPARSGATSSARPVEHGLARSRGLVARRRRGRLLARRRHQLPRPPLRPQRQPHPRGRGRHRRRRARPRRPPAGTPTCSGRSAAAAARSASSRRSSSSSSTCRRSTPAPRSSRSSARPRCCTPGAS